MNKICTSALLLTLIIACTACGEVGSFGGSNPAPTLSNAELRDRGLANLEALTSYHLVFTWINPVQLNPALTSLSVAGDIRAAGNGSQLQVESHSGIAEDDIVMGSQLQVQGADIYESSDGRTWSRLGPQSMSVALVVLWYGCIWPLTADSQLPHATAQNIAFLKTLDFQEGNPVVETLDGVPTRHMVTAFPPPTATDQQATPGLHDLLFGGQTLSIWVSTDGTPVLRQLRVEGRTRGSTNDLNAVEKEFAATWQWSRLNAEFGTPAPLPPAGK